MKLLGWMHRKFRHNGGKPFKDFAASDEDNDLYTSCPSNCLSSGPSPHHQQHYNSKQPLKLPNRQNPAAGQWFYLEDDEDPPIDDDQLFYGLLTIGTLGSPGTGENERGTTTPTFGLPPAALAPVQPTVDSIAEMEKHNETTKLDLKVISTELEKVRVVPEGDRLSSARASQVSAKQLVVSSCPLQENILGVSMEKTEQQRKEEKDLHHQRMSLAELFMKSKLTEEGGGDGGGCGGEGKKKSALGVQLIVKKMLKRRGSTNCLSSPMTISGGGDKLASGSKGKFQKIIQMFQKKIHPENSMAAKGKNKGGGDGGGGAGTSVLVSAAKGKLPRKESAEEHSYRSISPASDSIITGSSDSNGNREQWIKTDADYLVLEL